MLHHLQKNKETLSTQQLQMLGQLMQNFRMMQQHQHQIRLQQQQHSQQQTIQMPQQQITSPTMQQAYQQPMPNNQNGMYLNLTINS